MSMSSHLKKLILILPMLLIFNVIVQASTPQLNEWYAHHSSGLAIHIHDVHGMSWTSVASKICNDRDGWQGYDFTAKLGDARLSIGNGSTFFGGIVSYNYMGDCEIKKYDGGCCTQLYSGFSIYYEMKKETGKAIGDCEKETKCNSLSSLVGNPINVATGNKYQAEFDYIGGSNTGLNFTRHYNSQGTFGNDFGGHWSHTYEAHLQKTYNGLNVFMMREDGQLITFNLVGSNWIADADISLKLFELPTAEWVLTHNNGIVETFNSIGKLTSIKDKGKLTTLTYNLDNRLETVTGPFGHKIGFTYNASYLLDTVTLPDSKIYQYNYDEKSNLSSVTDADSKIKQYHYENITYPYHLTGITDERGIRYSSYSYNLDGLGKQTTYANGVNKRDISYPTTDMAVVTDSLSRAKTYQFITQHNTRKVEKITNTDSTELHTTYDTNGYLESYIDTSGHKTSYINNANGLVISKPIAVGTSEERTITYNYDDSVNPGKVTITTEPSVAPGQNKVTRYTYDAFGNRTSVTITGFKPDGSPVSRTTTYKYNGPLNQLSEIDGPRTDVADITTIEYYLNDAGQGNNRGRVQNVITSGLPVRSNIHYTATGKVSSEQRLNGINLSYTYYPGNDRLESLTETSGSGARTTFWTYLPTGEVASITHGVGSAGSTTITFGYDDARRLTSITDNNGNKMEYILDTEGNRINENIYDSTNFLHRTLTQTFDLYNQLDTTTRQNDIMDYNFSADGTLDTSVNGNGTTTDYSYDALKRLTQTTQDLGGIEPATQNTTSAYGYDVQDNLTRVTDPVNGNTVYVYDDLGNLLQQNSPDSGATLFTYDDAGNVKTKTDANNNQFNYQYDALNRLTLVDVVGSTGLDTIYTYDNCSDGAGRLCAIQQGNESVQYDYNQTRSQKNVVAHQGIRYVYDDLDRISYIHYPSGNVIGYKYNNLGQVIHLTSTEQAINASDPAITRNLASNILYKPFGPITELTYGNGATLTQNYDQAYRMTAQSTAGIYEVTYPLYDGNSNLTQRTNTLLAQSHDYNYDALNRLNEDISSSIAIKYVYDKNGNRTQFNANTINTTYNYTTGSNRIDTINNGKIYVDANGNIIQNTLHNFQYDAFNRLVSVDTNATCTYNGLNQRISKTVNGETTHYVYNVQGQLLAELNNVRQSKSMCI